MNLNAVFDSFPLLTTERLHLRAFTAADVDATLRLYRDPDVMRWLDIEAISSEDEAREIIDFYRNNHAQRRSIRWAITRRDQNDIIGACGYNVFDHESHWAEIGYELLPAHWGQGIMSEALRAMLRFGLDTVGLHRIEANVTVGNDASVRLLQRLGFAREGLLRERLFVRGAYHDLLWYGLVGPLPDAR